MNKNLTYYEEAMRYYNDAKNVLNDAGIQNNGKYYDDVKCVKSAAGIAYAGVEQAAKWYLRLRGFTSKYGSYESIMQDLTKTNKYAKDLFRTCNEQLHKNIYYRNEKNIEIVKAAFKAAKAFIELLKPYNKKYVYKKGGKVKAATPKSK